MPEQRKFSQSDPAYICYLLDKYPMAVERGIVAIYRKQTKDEQAHHTTTHTNGVGFNAADAYRGTYYAKWVLSGKRLTGWHLTKAREIAKRYVRQLSSIAEDTIESQHAKDERAGIQAAG